MSLSAETSFWIILGIIALQIMKFTYHGNYFGGRRRKTNNRTNQSKRASLWIKKHSSSWSCAFPFRWYHGLLMLINQFWALIVQTLLKHLTLSRSPKSPRRFFPNSRESHITTVLTAIRNSNFTQVLQCPKSMTAHLQKSFPSKSLIPTSDLSNGKMVKTLTGGPGMKNMEKNSTGSDQKLWRTLNPTEFTRRGLTTFEFSTDLTPVDTYWQ